MYWLLRTHHKGNKSPQPRKSLSLNQGFYSATGLTSHLVLLWPCLMGICLSFQVTNEPDTLETVGSHLFISSIHLPVCLRPTAADRQSPGRAGLYGSQTMPFRYSHALWCGRRPFWTMAVSVHSEVGTLETVAHWGKEGRIVL